MEEERPKNRQSMPSNARKVFKGELFNVYQWEQELYDGSKAIFEKLEREDTVVILPSTPEKKLLLLEDEQPSREPVLTFPAGRMDKEGESPLAAAQRELLEETGYTSMEWMLWKAYQPVTKIEWAVYVFVAKNCRKTADISLDAGERITVEEVTLDHIFSLLKNPKFEGGDIAAELTEAKYSPEARKLLETTLFG